MAKVSVQVIGLDKALSDIKSYVRRKHQGLIGVVANSSSTIQADARTLAPKDLGELKSDIHHVVKTKSSAIEGEVLSAAPYSGYVEWGTSPHYPPISALEGWASRHGMSPYAVAQSIAKKGTPAQPFMDPAYRKEKPKFINGVIKVMSSP